MREVIVSNRLHVLNVDELSERTRVYDFIECFAIRRISKYLEQLEERVVS